MAAWKKSADAFPLSEFIKRIIAFAEPFTLNDV